MTKLAQFALGCAIGVAFAACAVVAVYFRPFWHSAWGMPTFLLIFWIVMTLTVGWGGRGRPHSFRFGLIVSTAITSCFVAAVFINKYVGIGLICLLAYVAVKFLENSNGEPDPDPGDKQS
ncbi:hypothetical protein [Rhizobium sp. LjRoot254]|uniref:hypothetical protein n=1 Tax=Rhizobium sp. LjRoot254 TaxID=3342297 RepID=UPI003ECCFB2C